MVAEVMVSGDDSSTTGAMSDFKQATANAAKFVRHYGFDRRLSRTDIAQGGEENVNTDIGATNAAIEALLGEEYARAGRLLHEHSGVFMLIAQVLVDHGEVPRQKLADWLGLQLESEPSLLEPYANRLAAFESQLRTMDRLVGKRPCMEAEAA